VFTALGEVVMRTSQPHTIFKGNARFVPVLARVLRHAWAMHISSQGNGTMLLSSTLPEDAQSQEDWNGDSSQVVLLLAITCACGSAAWDFVPHALVQLIGIPNLSPTFESIIFVPCPHGSVLLNRLCSCAVWLHADVSFEELFRGYVQRFSSVAS